MFPTEGPEPSPHPVPFEGDQVQLQAVERELRASQERYRILLENANDAIVAFSILPGGITGKFIEANAAAVRLVGYSREEHLRMSPLDVEVGESRPSRAQVAAEMNQRGRCTFEVDVRRRDGAIIPIEVSGHIFMMEGVPIVISIMRDISQRREEQRRQQLEMELRLHAGKLEAIGRLAGGVAHDFNNILAGMTLQLDAMLRRKNLDGVTKRELAELQESAGRASNLTRQLLMFSRRSVLQVRRLELNAIIDTMLKMLRRLLGEQLSVDFSTGSASIPIEADLGMMEQVIMNLAINARDSMPKGGILRLRTDPVVLGPGDLASHPEGREGCFARLLVSDNGCGMSEETKERLFEPFYTTKEVGKGTGLGLATVHGIVQQHRGWIEVQSTLGIGSTFTVFIPVSELPLEPKANSGADSRPPLVHGSETILLAEDEAFLRKVIAHFLRSLGYTVHEASNAPEALELWSQHKDEVDLLFTDMVMPKGYSGLDLARILLEAKPSLPVIISTGYSEELIDRSPGLPPGVIVIPKPENPAELAELMRNTLDKRTSG